MKGSSASGGAGKNGGSWLPGGWRKGWSMKGGCGRLSACWGTRSPSIPCQESSEPVESDGDGDRDGTAGGGSC
jgi:hypothetical protein